jgi:hypothetical protein
MMLLDICQVHCRIVCTPIHICNIMILNINSFLQSRLKCRGV